MAAIDRSENIREREKIVKEIAKTSDTIRKKLRALKTGKIEKDIELDAHFKPLIGPLKKIVDNPSLIAVKKEEPTESDADAGIETFPVQQRVKEEGEEDATPKRKRERSYSWLDLSLTTPRKSNHSKRSKVLPITSTPSAATRTVEQHVSPEFLADANVFETTDDSIATTVQKQLQTSTGREMFVETLQDHLGPLSRVYIASVLSACPTIDTVYGVYLGNDGMMLGNKRFDVDKADNIYIDDVRYAGTPGIYELIFKKVPNDEIYTEDDKQKYRSILLATSAHKFRHDPRERVLGNKGYKYTRIIAPLISTESSVKRKKSGKGLPIPRAMTLTDNKIDYVHWDDPNELVDRLRLLDASRQAGNNAHDNEITSIFEELREAGLIIN